MAKTAERAGNVARRRPAQEEIAVLARAIYEQRGCLPGQDLQCWLEAEKRLMAAREDAALPKLGQRLLGFPAVR
jgi:hypothetical protein